jgi:hypothetical protein
LTGDWNKLPSSSTASPTDLLPRTSKSVASFRSDTLEQVALVPVSNFSSPVTSSNRQGDTAESHESSSLFASLISLFGFSSCCFRRDSDEG